MSQNTVWILTSIEEEWGRGSTRQEAIENAVAKRETGLCDGEMLPVNHDTILERLQYGAGNGGLDLYDEVQS